MIPRPIKSHVAVNIGKTAEIAGRWREGNFAPRRGEGGWDSAFALESGFEEGELCFGDLVGEGEV